MESADAEEIAASIHACFRSLGISCLGIYSADDIDNVSVVDADDLDLRAVIDDSILDSRVSSHARTVDISSGSVLRFDSIPEVMWHALSGTRVLVDLCTTCKSSLSDHERLLSSHVFNAASTNLYRGQLLYSNKWLLCLHRKIRLRFTDPVLIHRRVQWAANQARSHVTEALKLSSHTDQDMWRCVVRPIIGYGRIHLTRALLGLSTRSFMPKVRLACDTLNEQWRLVELTEKMGLGRLSKKDCVAWSEQLRACYSDMSQQLDDVNLHPLKERYWFVWIRNSLAREDVPAAAFAITYIASRAMSLLHRKNEAPPEVLCNILGSLKEKTGIMNIACTLHTMLEERCSEFVGG